MMFNFVRLIFSTFLAYIFAPFLTTSKVLNDTDELLAKLSLIFFYWFNEHPPLKKKMAKERATGLGLLIAGAGKQSKKPPFIKEV